MEIYVLKSLEKDLNHGRIKSSILPMVKVQHRWRFNTIEGSKLLRSGLVLKKKYPGKKKLAPEGLERTRFLGKNRE